MERNERPDRTWMWIPVALLLAVILSCGIWNRRPPANSVDQAAIDAIERALTAEGFVLTNSSGTRSEAVPFGIPVSRILGTVDESASLPFRKDGTELKIDYAIKGNRPFNITIWADPTNSARATQVAQSLRQWNAMLLVQIWTNHPAP